jgi:hypothetical protein
LPDPSPYEGGSGGVLVLKTPVKAGCLAAVKTAQEGGEAKPAALRSELLGVLGTSERNAELGITFRCSPNPKTLVAAINAVALLRNRVKLCGDSDSKDIDQ